MRLGGGSVPIIVEPLELPEPARATEREAPAAPAVAEESVASPPEKQAPLSPRHEPWLTTRADASLSPRRHTTRPEHSAHAVCTRGAGRGPDGALSRGKRRFPAVASWGPIQVHDDGFRARNACIVVLAHLRAEPPQALARLTGIAGRYAVELVPFGDLEQAASRHGSPIPDTLRPALVIAETEPSSAPATPPSPAPDLAPEDVIAPKRIGFDGQRLPGDVWRGPGGRP
jgi:hypothetical protein